MKRLKNWFKNLFSKKYTLQINYESGHVRYIKAKKFDTKIRGGGLAEIKWEGVEPRPLYMGVDRIESIWKL